MLANQVQGTYVLGKCPKIHDDWQSTHKGEKLDVSKVSGDWYNVWESYVRQMHSECLRIRLKPIQGETKRVQLLQGVSFKEDDQVVFNDNKVLNFGHPTDSAIASIQAIEELHGEINEAEAVKQLDSLNLPELKQETRDDIDMMDLDLYERAREETTLTKESILDGIAQGNRFADPYRILDTDYESYMVIYQCREVHRKGQETDFVLSEGESYREFIEEYASEKHDKIIANRALQEHQESEVFDSL